MTQLSTQQRRRALSAMYRVLSNEGDAQCRALDRLTLLVSEEFAFDVWLSTKPDPKLVEQIIRHRLLSRSPLCNMTPKQSLPWLADTVKVNRSVSVWS